MAIRIEKSVNKIAALVAAISTKSGAYKEGVSSALVSSVAHAIETGDYTLIEKLRDEVLAANPRDLKVIFQFLKDLTPFHVEPRNVGRIVSFDVLGRIAKGYLGLAQKDYKTVAAFETAKKEQKAKDEKRDAGRVTVFAQFIGTAKDDKGVSLPRGAVVRNESGEKEVFDYALNVFAWFDDVQYFRNASAGGAAGEKEFDFDATFVSKVGAMIKAFAGQTLTDEQKAIMDTIETFYNAASKRKTDADEKAKADKAAAALKAKEDKALAAMKDEAVKRLEKAGIKDASEDQISVVVDQIKQEKAVKKAA